MHPNHASANILTVVNTTVTAFFFVKTVTAIDSLKELYKDDLDSHEQ